MSAVVVTFPARIVSALNLRECWQVKAKRAQAQRRAAWVALRHTLGRDKPLLAAQPLTITLTRIAPRRLDDDNNVSGFKAVRDGVADYLDAQDNDPRITWRYSQSTGKPREYAVRITLEPRV